VIPVSTRFNVPARTDVGVVGLPDDPDVAAKIVRLRRQRDLLQNELATATSATESENRWQAEVKLIDLALAEIDRDIATEQTKRESIGASLAATAIDQVDVELETVPTVRFRIGSEAFVYQEDLDWAERGSQLARSDLHCVAGECTTLIPASWSEEYRERLLDHLNQSLFTFATDVRDRAFDHTPLPEARLADLAMPNTTDGGWLDWLGASPVIKRRNAAVAKLEMDRDRLATDRSALLADQAKVVEHLPFIRRRLREVDEALAIVSDPDYKPTDDASDRNEPTVPLRRKRD